MLKGGLLIFGSSDLEYCNSDPDIHTAKGKSYSFFSSWRNCFVSRSCYWEQVVFYPTANLLELKSIIKNQVSNISPITGETQAHIINLDTAGSAVLYCCFPDELVLRAEKAGLWRLTPITLPFYREFSKRLGIYSVAYRDCGYQFKNGNNNLPDEDEMLLFQIANEALSSLPIIKEQKSSFLAVKCNEAQLLSRSEVYETLSKPNLLKCFDLIKPISSYIQFLKKRWGSYSKYAIAFLSSLFITYHVGMTVFLLLQSNSLNKRVDNQRQQANIAINVVNKVDEIKAQVAAVNKQLEESHSKLAVLDTLSSMRDKDDTLIFQTLEIFKYDIKITGVSKNATETLSNLIELAKFEDIKFISPPASRGNTLEFFNISLTYSPNKGSVHNNDER